MIDGAWCQAMRLFLQVDRLYLMDMMKQAGGRMKLNSPFRDKLDESFLIFSANILADTNKGLSGAKIIEYFNGYAIDYGKNIPFAIYPFDAPNKRTAFVENIRCFNSEEQFRIIKDLCDLPCFIMNDQVNNLRVKLFSRYGNLSAGRLSDTEIIQKTKHWLADYPEALKQYESALNKYEGGIFERNALDDIRLSFELLVKSLLGNDKSLENQIPGICTQLQQFGASKELMNMIHPIIKYYTDFQNHHVKHNDSVNKNEMEYVIELTSIIMKFLIKANVGKS